METYHGRVLSPADAIILFEACRLGTLPRVQRRLSEKERQSIKAGSVFVWDEREAGMRRWTDGKSWSASRVSGSFLTYREMEGKRSGGAYQAALSRAGKTPESTKGSDSDADGAGEEGPDGYRYKPDGLMKSSFSITTTTGNHLHLISYHPRQGPIGAVPSQDPALRHIRAPKGLYPESSINDQTSIPAVTRTPMANPPVSHMPPNPYQRSGGPIYPPQPNNGWNHPGSLPQSYGQHPPNAIPPPPQQFIPAPLAYPQPMSAAPIAALNHSYSSARTHTPPIDGTTRLPPVLGHHRNGSTDSHKSGYPSNQSYPRVGPRSNNSRSGSPSNSSIASRTDPRLVAPSPLTQNRVLPGLVRDTARSHTRTPSPTQRRDLSTTPTSRDTAISSASIGKIPGIGALVNGALEHEARSRSQSRSPASGYRGLSGPQDIPHSKIAFGGEDMRALRVLDRAFKT